MPARMETAGASPARSGRVVIRGVNWLGDAVMTTPALLRLREAWPEAELTLLTQEKLAPIWKGHPALHAVLPFPARAGVWSVAREVRARGFGTALVLPNSPRSALEVWLARVPRRVGGAWPWRNFLLTDVVPHPASGTLMRKRSDREIAARRAMPPGTASTRETYPAEAHQSLHYLRLVARLGADPTPVAPRLAVSLEEMEAVRVKFGIEAGVRWVGMNAGAEYGPAKRWPTDRFAAVGRALAGSPGLGLLLFGGPGDVELARTIRSELESVPLPCVNLAGRTTLRELMATLATCRVLLTNDTGPMHVAAALGVPVVVPFGSTSPELTGPGQPGDPRHALLRGMVPCAPCFRRECPVDLACLASIPLEAVVEAIRQRL